MAIKYELVEGHPQSFHANHWSVKLLEGDYAGVVYQYDTISFDENKESGEVTMTFTTITCENDQELDLTTPEFETTIGDILSDLISKQLEASQQNENGTNDTGASAQ
jgi:hypothetical protein